MHLANKLGMKTDMAARLTDAITFLVIAIVAGIFGFSGITGTVALAGRTLASVSFALTLLSLFVGWPRRA
jgi:uncharacterized membrane protein YtjA (UPF0391 family)